MLFIDENDLIPNEYIATIYVDGDGVRFKSVTDDYGINICILLNLVQPTAKQCFYYIYDIVIQDRSKGDMRKINAIVNDDGFLDILIADAEYGVSFHNAMEIIKERLIKGIS